MINEINLNTNMVTILYHNGFVKLLYRQGVKFTLCRQLQLPQRPWKTLKLYFYAIFSFALMGIRQKMSN